MVSKVMEFSSNFPALFWIYRNLEVTHLIWIISSHLITFLCILYWKNIFYHKTFLFYFFLYWRKKNTEWVELGEISIYISGNTKKFVTNLGKVSHLKVMGILYSRLFGSIYLRAILYRHFKCRWCVFPGNSASREEN